MRSVNVIIEVEVNPTEDADKVKQAVMNVFGNLSFDEKPGYRGILLSAEVEGWESLAEFGKLLRRERIRDSARKVLFGGLDGTTITFFLNKQVAYAGHVSFCEPVAESPLGPIKVKIEGGGPKLINWLAPRSR